MLATKSPGPPVACQPPVCKSHRRRVLVVCFLAPKKKTNYEGVMKLFECNTLAAIVSRWRRQMSTHEHVWKARVTVMGLSRPSRPPLRLREQCTCLVVQ